MSKKKIKRINELLQTIKKLEKVKEDLGGENNVGR